MEPWFLKLATCWCNNVKDYIFWAKQINLKTVTRNLLMSAHRSYCYLQVLEIILIFREFLVGVVTSVKRRPTSLKVFLSDCWTCLATRGIRQHHLDLPCTYYLRPNDKWTLKNLLWRVHGQVRSLTACVAPHLTYTTMRYYTQCIKHKPESWKASCK